MYWAPKFLQALAAGLCLASAATAAPTDAPTKTLSERQSSNRYVFAHFMVQPDRHPSSHRISNADSC